jgi:hypothetical protein
MKDSMNLLTRKVEHFWFDPEEYAEAAITSNPNILWVKFVFVDDQPDELNRRVAQAEFDNIIRSGAHMPIKMEDGNPDGNHPDSFPIGVITNLVQRENRVIGLAALWKEERKEDVSLLASKHQNGDPLNLSWELFYANSEVDEDGITDLQGITVRAITFVGNPAYAGRTNVLAVAQNQEENLEEQIKELKDKVSSLEQKLADANAEAETLKSQLNEANSASAEFENVQEELKNLREYKTQREEQDAYAEKKATRLNVLSEAGITWTEEQWAEKEERLMGMDDEMYTFFVQELVANLPTGEEASASTNPPVPDLSHPGSKKPLDTLRSKLIKE